MQSIKHAVICAAGLGSRLELNIPKCMVNIGHKRIIDYQLDILKDIEDIRIVVGFMEEQVIEYVRKIREDIIFVRNPDYKVTSNSYSAYLASKDIKEPFLLIDGDLLIDSDSFANFLKICNGKESVIGYTESKTEEAVFVSLNAEGNQIYEFIDLPKQDILQRQFEWCGVAYLKNIKIMNNAGYIYSELTKHLPLKAHYIKCYEIDTPKDLSLALKEFRLVDLNN
jgi:choline kinase